MFFIGEEFEKIRTYLQSEDGKKQVVESFSAGVARVREEKYGFICETMVAKYIENTRPCDLTTVSEFALRSYGLAVPSNSPHLEKLHSIVLEMMENGDMEALELRWFQLKGECWNVTAVTNVIAKASALFLNVPKRVNMRMFWSVLVIMIVGVILSVLTAITEILWYKYRGRVSFFFF